MKFLQAKLSLALLLLVAGGCNRQLSEELIQQAQFVSSQQSQASGAIASSQTLLSQLPAQSEAKTLQIYAERENWKDDLVQSQNKLAQAQKLISQNIQPALTRNEKSEQAQVEAWVSQARDLLQQAQTLGNRPAQRIESLRQLSTQGASQLEAARVDWNRAQALAKQSLGQVQKTRARYPKKQSELDKMSEQTQSLRSQAQREWEAAQSEWNNFKQLKPADFGQFSSHVQGVANSTQELEKHSVDSKNRMGELDQSYSKTLIDMKLDYFVRIGRESWNESSESESTTEYVFPPSAVDRPTYEYFSQFAEDTVLASQGTGWLSNSGFTLSNGVDAQQWQKLNIQPSQDLSDGTAEWSLEETDDQGFHKYLIVENGEKRETDWEKVTPEFFEAHEDDLGMDIASKAPGFFANEMNEQNTFAAPAGFVHVNNPQYGQWRTDSSGQRFWEFYGPYLFFRTLLGMNQPYSYSTWQSWDRDYRGRRPFYGTRKGPNGEEDQYGTSSRSVGANSYYARSYWVSSGEHRAQINSMRAAGSNTRGGGPGGGGK